MSTSVDLVASSSLLANASCSSRAVTRPVAVSRSDLVSARSFLASLSSLLAVASSVLTLPSSSLVSFSCCCSFLIFFLVAMSSSTASFVFLAHLSVSSEISSDQTLNSFLTASILVLCSSTNSPANALILSQLLSCFSSPSLALAPTLSTLVTSFSISPSPTSEIIRRFSSRISRMSFSALSLAFCSTRNSFL